METRELVSEVALEGEMGSFDQEAPGIRLHFVACEDVWIKASHSHQKTIKEFGFVLDDCQFRNQWPQGTRELKWISVCSFIFLVVLHGRKADDDALKETDVVLVLKIFISQTIADGLDGIKLRVGTETVSGLDVDLEGKDSEMLVFRVSGLERNECLAGGLLSLAHIKVDL